MEQGGRKAPQSNMARSRRKVENVGLAVEAVASAELAQTAPVKNVVVVRIAAPVWLYNSKAKVGDVVTVDADLARRLIGQGQANAVTD